MTALKMHLLASATILLIISVGVVHSARKGQKIVGGSPAGPTDFPFFAALMVKYSGGWEFRCGSTIINANTVVTSAHCVHLNDGLKRGQFKVLAGVHRTKELQGETGKVQSFKAQQITPHNCYKRCCTHKTRSDAHDLAIIRIDGRFNFNEYVQPIEMPPKSNSGDIDGDRVWIVGFGYEHRGSYVLPQQLQKIEVPIVHKGECQRIYDVLYNWNHATWDRLDLSEGQFCASDMTRGRVKGVCWGDQGGGVYERSGDKWILRGVVSFYTYAMDSKLNCLRVQKEIPDVHTQIARYTCWIQNPQNWDKCEIDYFGPSCDVTKPTTVKTTTSRTTTTDHETEQTTDYDYTDVTDDKEIVTASGTHLFPSLFAFLSAIFLQKIATNA